MARRLFLLSLLFVLLLSICQIIPAQTVFTDVTNEAGLNSIDGHLNSLAVVWIDYDNDGDMDIYISHGGWSVVIPEPNVFYRNNGDGTFTDVTAEAGLEARTADSEYATSLDYDNDGYADLFIHNYNVDKGVILYHNNGDGTFTDVTEEAGIEKLAIWSYGSTFGDYDGDGDLDMYLAVFWTNPNVFYSNNGDGTFTNVADEVGLADSYSGFNAVSGDYDNDGDLDIYLANGKGWGPEPCRLFSNKGDGTFKDVTKQAGVDDERDGRCCAFSDYDNDGDLDLLAAGCHSTAHFYLNNGDGTFTDYAKEAGFWFPIHTERLTVGDYDNDGYMDVFLFGNGWARLYHNNGDGTLTDVALRVGIRINGGTGGCAFADYDNDGDLDLYAARYGYDDILYRNDGCDNHWLRLKCVGSIGDIPINVKRTNRDGVGVRVIVQAGELSMMREINGGCSRAQHSMTAHFGLGQNTRADSVEIRWPSGQVTTMSNISADQMIQVREGEEGYKILYSGEGISVQPQGKLPSTWGKVKKTELFQNYPNPFNPETWIPYQLGEDSSVVIRIRTSSGQLVRTLELGDRPAGLYIEKIKAAHWDGNNEAGEPVASGIYFYTIKAGDKYTATKKMIIAR